MSQHDQIERISLEVYEHARQSALVNLRFLMHASALLKPLPVAGSALVTDGVRVQYDPHDLVVRWRDEPTRLTRAYVHMVLHNVFLHTYPGKVEHPQLWDLACDIVVESVIRDLNAPSLATSMQPAQNQAIDSLGLDTSTLTAESAYLHFLEAGLQPDEAQSLRAPFLVDDHACWHAANYRAVSRERSPATDAESGDEAQQADKQEAAPSGDSVDSPQASQRRRSSHQGVHDDSAKDAGLPDDTRQALGSRLANTVNLERARQHWEQAAYETGIQLDTYIKLWGANSGSMSMQLTSVVRKHQDYREFLRKFAHRGEHIRINNDDFDYVHYCYGLKLYGNLPLIEPLEYAEERRIREFAIAIDTSASTKDGLVKTFLEQTSSVIGNDESFFEDARIILFQCDAAIADETHIKTKHDFDVYIDNPTVEGLGGTDFRPVFARIEELMDAGELHEFAGLIYFTDGFGTYPKTPPPFKTAFVFADEIGAEAATVPSWAMKAVLNKNRRVMKGQR